MGIEDTRICLLEEPTRGQAETVEFGINHLGVDDATPLTIFNIDTFRPGFTFPDFARHANSFGYLEVFRGQGANWSYVLPSPGEAPKVLETAEKRPISDLCCTGLYHFAHAGDFREALAMERLSPSAAELYVAPLYNYIIAAGKTCHYVIIPPEQVVFCGIPAEYDALKAVARFQDDTETNLLSDTSSLHDRARSAERRRNWHEAECLWRRFLGLNERMWWAHTGLAGAVREQGRMLDAANVLLAAQKILPGEPRLYVEYARIAEHEGNLIEALRRWRQVQEQFASSWLGFWGEASTLRSMQRVAEADALISEVTSRFLDNTDALHDLARTAEHQCDWSAAERLWRRFIELDDNPWWVHAGLANALHRLGRNEEAAAILNTARHRFPNETELAIVLAKIEEAVGNFADAAKIWDELTGTSANRSDVWIGAVRNQRKLGNLVAADARLRDGLHHLPKDETLIVEAVANAEGLGESETLVGLLRKLWEIRPHDGSIGFKLVQAYASANLVEEAYRTIGELLRAGHGTYRVFSVAVALARASASLKPLFEHWEELVPVAANDPRGFAADCVDLLIAFVDREDCNLIIRTILLHHWDMTSAQLPAAIQSTVALRAGPNRNQAWNAFVRVFESEKNKIRDEFQQRFLSALIMPKDENDVSEALLTRLLREARPDNWIKDAVIVLFSPYFRTPSLLSALRDLIEKTASEMHTTTEPALYILLILADVLSEGSYDQLIEATRRCGRFADVAPGSNNLSATLARIVSRSAVRSSPLLPLPASVLERPLRIAVCVSGQLRGYEAALPTWQSLGLWDHHLSFVVHTWKNVGRNLPDQATSAARSFDGDFLKSYQDVIRARGWNYMRQSYPCLIDAVLGHQVIDEAELTKFYNACSVVIDDETVPPFIGRGNFWKMYYKINRAHLLGMESCPNADIVVRIRPDKVFHGATAIDWHRVLWESKHHRIILADRPRMLAPPFWIGDQFAAGVPEVMEIYANTFNLTEEAKETGAFDFPRTHFGHLNLAYATFQDGVGVRSFQGIGVETLKNAKIITAGTIVAALRKDVSQRSSLSDDDVLLSAALRDL
jgi:tetratricopeptide (TPR) repeat protein